jgi:hypothetical protein
MHASQCVRAEWEVKSALPIAASGAAPQQTAPQPSAAVTAANLLQEVLGLPVVRGAPAAASFSAAAGAPAAAAGASAVLLITERGTPLYGSELTNEALAQQVRLQKPQRAS